MRRLTSYRYFDATPKPESLEGCVEETVERDLPEEVAYLEAFGEFSQRVQRLLGVCRTGRWISSTASSPRREDSCRRVRAPLKARPCTVGSGAHFRILSAVPGRDK